jgi:thiol-disulfide isomerase/thioredoxin
MRILPFLLILLMFSFKSETKSNKVIAKVEAVKMEPIDLEVYDFEGLKEFLSTSNNKTYVVNFWATWCAPCVKELPYFEKLNVEYKNKAVEVILVSLDFPQKYETRLKPFIKENKLQSKVIALNDVDSNSWIPKVSKEWSGAIPATLIFNKEKRQFYEQSFNFEELEIEIKQFLK